jgi:pyridoxal 5'-phosphate synthase pdxT subunit
MVAKGTKSLKIGVLALQGCIDPHIKILSLFNDIVPVKVKETSHLNQIDGLILPGGESSTMLKLINTREMFSSLQKFCRKKPSWGICAGAILLANQVENPNQKSLDAIDIIATRNAYGSQQDSFTAEIDVFLPSKEIKLRHKLFLDKSETLPKEQKVTVDFIRAPKLAKLKSSDSIISISEYKSLPIALVQKNTLVTSFHSEVLNELNFTGYSLTKCGESKIGFLDKDLTENIKKKLFLYYFFLNNFFN